ncbi:MAG: CHAD domain-containing protein [Methanoregula sp.]|jgi:CHAD domain-containing protein
MIPPHESGDTGHIPDAGLIFGAPAMLDLLDSFGQEIPGVREGKDPEHLHRMRVASRRLRAALPLALSEHDQKEHRAWLRQVKDITRSLGAARDLDVQIIFLKKYRKSLAKEASAEPDNGGGVEPSQNFSSGKPSKKKPLMTDSYKDPLTLLLTRLQKKRKPLQEDVLLALDNLEKNRLPEQMHSFFIQIDIARKKRGARVLQCCIPPVAAERIGQCLKAVHHYAPWVHNPDSVFEHHALRIATKKLRYTLEYYAPVYRRHFAKQLIRIKKLQDLLGEIHDCDVWIDQVSIAIVRQRCRSHSPGEVRCAEVSTVAPLRRLLENREKRRMLLYRQFVRFWDSLSRTGFWDELRQVLLFGQKIQFRSLAGVDKNACREAFEKQALDPPDLNAHVHTVTTLALRLFDELSTIHQLQDHDREILAYAALIHDIGWKYGREGHQKKSAEMILSRGNLPVPLPDLALVALAAGFHGGSPRVRLPGIWFILNRQDQIRARRLGAIIRIADGLDYSHTGIVTDLKCSLREPEVYCELIVSADAGVEKARAEKKSDLFSEVFGRPLVIA